MLPHTKEYRFIYPSRCLLISLYLGFSLLCSAQWVRKADGLRTRSELGETVVYNSKIYSFTGFTASASKVETTNEVYDPATNTWKYIASMPANTAMTHQDIILVDNTIWLIGGRTGQNPAIMSSEIWIYNISTNTWSKGPDILNPSTGKPMVIAASGSGLIGRTLHIFGGFTPTPCDDDQDQYHLSLDLDKWLANTSAPAPWENNLKPLPLKRNHFSSVVLGGKIYAIGGQLGHDCGGGKEVPYCHVYNPATDTWKQLTSLPEGRSHAEGATFAIDGKIYIAGGQKGSGGSTTSTIMVFDPAANNGNGSWVSNSFNLPGIYEGLSATVVGNNFIMSHGSLGPVIYAQKATYAMAITRKPVYKLGFPSECLNLSDANASTLKGNTWLFTIDGTKSYTTTSSVSWLTVTKNARGTATTNAVDIEVTANPKGLLPGTYNATITAKGVSGGITYSSASLCVKLVVTKYIDTLKYNLNLITNGNGLVNKNPAEVSYPSGTNVLLKALPDSGFEFEGWSGDVSSNDDSIIVNIDGDKSIVANFAPVPFSITDLSAITGRNYELDIMQTDSTLYTDRLYIVTSVPEGMDSVPIIKTPNDDKTSNSDSVFSFTINKPSTIFIAYDPRATSLPAWMSEWQKVDGIQLGISDPKVNFLNLYSRTFPPGEITLGGNLQKPASGALDNYIVIVQPLQTLSRGIGSNTLSVKPYTVKSFKPLSSFPYLKIYPNPNTGNKIWVEGKSAAKNKLMFISINSGDGKIIQTTNVISNEQGYFDKSIHLNNTLAKGVYYIHVNSDSDKAQQKLIVL